MILDETNGVVMIGDGTTVASTAVLIGPLRIGLERAHLTPQQVDEFERMYRGYSGARPAPQEQPS